MAESKRSASTNDDSSKEAEKTRKKGLSATLARARQAASERQAGGLIGRAAAGFVSLVGALAAVAIELLTGVLRLARSGLEAVARPLGGLLGGLAGLVATGSRVLTPARVLLIAAIGCALLLGLSQFADYRGIAVGAGDYSGVEAVAPPPEIDRAETGSAHGYVMVPAALIAIALLMVAVRTRRWQLCRLVVVIGVAAVAVSIFIDRPAGLDEGTVARDFAGAQASLLGGFWVQLFAGVGLAATSGLLAAELRRLGPDSSRSRHAEPSPAAAPPEAAAPAKELTAAERSALRRGESPGPPEGASA